MTPEQLKNFLPMPKEWIGQYHNACTEPCDMLVGPCICGATHRIDEWLISRKKLTKSGWQTPADHLRQVLVQIQKRLDKLIEGDSAIDSLVLEALALLPCPTCPHGTIQGEPCRECSELYEKSLGPKPDCQQHSP